MGLSSQRVPEKEANWQRSVLHRGDQNHFRQRIRCGVPGKRCAAESKPIFCDKIWSFPKLPAVPVHGCNSGAQLDENNLISLVFFSHFRHDGGEHCRVFSQRGSRHSPQRRNQREHVRVLPLISVIPVFQAFVIMIRSGSMLIVVLISQRLFLSIRWAINHLECVVCDSAVCFS